MGGIPSWLMIREGETIPAQVTLISRNGANHLYEIKGPNGEGPVMFEWRNQKLSYDVANTNKRAQAFMD